jgi:hypothetical protein
MLRPREKYSTTTYLNSWALVTRPGTYQITGVYEPSTTYRPGEVPHSPISVTSSPVSVTIRTRPQAELDEYIHSLVPQLSSPGDAYNVVARLAFTGSPQIVPILLDLMYSGRGAYLGYLDLVPNLLVGYVPQSEEIWTNIFTTAKQRGLRASMRELLERYDLRLHGPDKKQITAASMFPVIVRSLAEDNPLCWQAGAEAARRYPNGAYISRLIAIATRPQARDRRENSIYALAEYRTDETVRALRLLLNDADPVIRKLTADHIRNVYQYQKLHMLTDSSLCLRDDDFDASFR